VGIKGDSSSKIAKGVLKGEVTGEDGAGKYSSELVGVCIGEWLTAGEETKGVVSGCKVPSAAKISI
jgi:hypothetical protein